MANSMIENVANAIRDSFDSNDIDYYRLAKVAIVAMREPTEEMLEAAKNVRINQSDDDPILIIYQAIIDAVLKE